jgi:hypothetical protein
LHQAGPNKPIYNDAWKHKNLKKYIYFLFSEVYKI